MPGKTATLPRIVTNYNRDELTPRPVTNNAPNGPKSKTAGSGGSYTFTGLPTGEYTVQASAPDLVLPQPARVALGASIRTLNLQLKIAATVQQVTVEDTGAPTVSTEASGNASAVTLKGSDLDALSDDLED